MRTRSASNPQPGRGVPNRRPETATGELGGRGQRQCPGVGWAIGADGHTSPDSVTNSAALSSTVASSDMSTSGGCSWSSSGSRRVRLYPIDHRVLVGLLGEVALRLLGEEEVDQLGGLGRAVGAGEHAGAGGHDQRPGAGVVEELVPGHGAALLGVEAQQVVVVDQAERYLPALDRGDDRVVVRVGDRVVGGEFLQPGCGRLLALGEDHGGDERQERPVGRRYPDVARPAGVDYLVQAPRQVLVPDFLAVVDDDPAPPGDGDPVAIGVGETGVDPGHHLVGERLEETFQRHQTKGARVLGKEHVGRGALPLGEDRGRQFGALPVADLQLDPGLLGEPIEQRADQVLAPTRVHHKRVRPPIRSHKRQGDRATAATNRTALALIDPTPRKS